MAGRATHAPSATATTNGAAKAQHRDCSRVEKKYRQRLGAGGRVRHCDLIIRTCAARRVGLRPAMMMILVSAVGRGRARRAAARVRTVTAPMRRGAGAGGSGPSASGAFVLPRAPPATRESQPPPRAIAAAAPARERRQSRLGESGPSPPRGGASASNRRHAGKSAGRHMPKTGPPLASEEKTISVKNVEEKKRKERKRKRGPERLRGRMTRATGGAGQHAAWERRRGGGAASPPAARQQEGCLRLAFPWWIIPRWSPGRAAAAPHARARAARGARGASVSAAEADGAEQCAEEGLRKGGEGKGGREAKLVKLVVRQQRRELGIEGKGTSHASRA